jgi:hypothetical protein
MKKNVKLMCVALVLSTTTMAQQAKTAPVAEAQKSAKSDKTGGVTNSVAKITFPPTVWTKNPRSANITILGTTEGGVVLETYTGAKLLVGADNNATPLEATKKWTPVKPIPSGPIVYKMIGTTDDGAQVWAGPDGKSCTLDVAKGQMVDYVGHVTLLK